MISEQRWLKISGLVILILMLIAAAFSLGVYIGEHGWTKEGLQYRPAQPQQGAHPPGQQPPPGLPPGRPQIIGRVQRITPDNIRLATQNGIRSILIQKQTRTLDENGLTVNRSEIQRGDIVGIFGKFIKEDGGQFQAEVIILLPPPNQLP